MNQKIYQKPENTGSAFKNNIIYEWKRLPPSKLLPKENSFYSSNTQGEQSNNNKKEKELKPVIIFGSSTTPRIPQLSATDNVSLKLEETTPYTTGKKKYKEIIAFDRQNKNNKIILNENFVSK